MIIEFIERDHITEKAENNFYTLEHFMKTIFTVQLVLVKIDEPDAVTVLSRLVDNINKASLEMERYTKQDDDKEGIIVAKVDVSENAYQLLNAVHKAMPQNDDLSFYVTMFDKMFSGSMEANAGDNRSEIENEDEHLVECDESEGANPLTDDNDMDPLITADEIERFTENTDEEEDILDEDTLNKVTDVIEDFEKTSGNEDLDGMDIEDYAANEDNEEDISDFIIPDFEEHSDTEPSDGDTGSKELKIVKKTDEDDDIEFF